MPPNEATASLKLMLEWPPKLSTPRRNLRCPLVASSRAVLAHPTDVVMSLYAWGWNNT